MNMKRYSQTKKDQLIREVKDCGSISLVSKKHQIPNSTLHAWVAPKPKKKLSESNESLQNLKKKLADQELKIKILEDLLKKTNQAWLGD
jgi:transposase-like protein|tara:strand:- start:578 stop:844 length:267 start_codon:yes stop_codon:yes gene_type:complete